VGFDDTCGYKGHLVMSASATDRVHHSFVARTSGVPGNRRYLPGAKQ